MNTRFFINLRPCLRLGHYLYDLFFIMILIAINDNVIKTAILVLLEFLSKVQPSGVA